MNTLSPLLRATLITLVILAAMFDYRSRRIPNWLTLAGVVTGLVMQSSLHRAAGLTASLEGLGLALLIYVPLYLLRGVGGGDVKLMAAVGAIAGPLNWLAILLITALVGGIFAIVLVASRHRIGQTLSNIRVMIASLGRGKAPFENNRHLDVRSEEALRMPHAIVIACGTVLFLAAGAVR